jgi:hypothetical protein
MMLTINLLVDESTSIGGSDRSNIGSARIIILPNVTNQANAT